MTKLTKSPDRRFTQWAAQFAAASELCKRGYDVAFTLGHNTPLADLMVISPKRKEHFLVDVKGLSSKNPWQVRRRQTRKDLYFILVLVPLGGQNEFFILSHAKVNRLIDQQRKRNKKKAGWREGFLFSAAAKCKDWDLIPR